MINNIYASEYRDRKAAWRTNTSEQIFERITALDEKESETMFRVRWIKNHIQSLWADGVVKKNDPPCNMLDIGGGTGVFAHEFRDSEWVAHVIDPDKGNSFIKNKLNIPLVQDYYKPGSFGCKFDLLTLIYVLEHVSDPLSLLQTLHADMNENSLLYIEVPDSVSFERKSADDDIFNSCHLWLFGSNTMAKLLDICGFELLSLDKSKTIRGHYALTVLAGPK